MLIWVSRCQLCVVDIQNSLSSSYFRNTAISQSRPKSALAFTHMPYLLELGGNKEKQPSVFPGVLLNWNSKCKQQNCDTIDMKHKLGWQHKKCPRRCFQTQWAQWHPHTGVCPLPPGAAHGLQASTTTVNFVTCSSFAVS